MAINDSEDEEITHFMFDYSQLHYDAALFFASKAEEIEEEYDPISERTVDKEEDTDKRWPYLSRHRSYVISSIIRSISLLEAVSNELFTWAIEAEDVSEGSNGRIGEEINHEIIRKINDTLDGSYTNKNFIAKYQLMLIYSGVDSFEPGQNPLQDVNTVRRLRNYFVHSEPEWIEWD